MSTSFTVTVPTTLDTIDEGVSETYDLTVGGVAALGTITDDDLAPTVSSVTSPTAAEGANLVYTVNLSNASATATTFPFALGGGSAAAADYTSATFSNGVTLAAGVLTVPAGVTSFTVTLPTVQDTLDEANETVPVTVGGVTGTGTITDDDATPSLAISDVSVNEGAGTATFTVTLSAASGQSVTVNYGTSNGTASAGSDYTAASGTLTFAPGVTSQTITVPITNDTVAEPNETFYVNLSAPTNAVIGDALGVGTIIDNDLAPTVASVSAASATEAGNLIHTVTLSNASSTPISLAYSLGGGTATVGADYAATPTFSNGVTLSGGVLTVPAGVTSFTVTVASVNDTIDEPAETYSLTVGGVVGTGTITDDDAAPALTVSSVTVAENAGFAVFTVALSNASASAVSLNLTLTPGSATGGGVDYGSGGATNIQVSTDGGASWTNATSATIAAGSTSVLVRTPIVNAGGTEAIETFTLTATVSAGTTSNTSASGTGTIVDQDVTVSSPTVNEGGDLVYNVTVAGSSTQTYPFVLGGSASAADHGTPVFSNGVTLAGGVLTVPNGVNFTVTIPTVNDVLDEADETLTVTIGGVTAPARSPTTTPRRPSRSTMSRSTRPPAPPPSRSR